MFGIVCHWLEEKNNKFVNVTNEKKLQYNKYKNGEYTDEFIVNTYVNNCNSLSYLIPKISLLTNVFRFSSTLLPLADIVSKRIIEHQKVVDALTMLGNTFLKFGMRVSTHPGQHCSLASNKEHVIDATIRELSIYGWIMDVMGCVRTPYYSINVHGGMKNTPEILASSLDKLPYNTRSRLTLENDETSWSVLNLLEVYKLSNVPIVFDSHHHSINPDNLLYHEAMHACFITWNNIKPLQHLSNSITNNSSSMLLRRKHSDYISYMPKCQFELHNSDLVDIDIEAKCKNLAVNKLLLDIKNNSITFCEEV